MSPAEQSLIAFTFAAALLTVTPGLDTALVLRTAVAEGPRRALAASLGVCLGCLAWGALAAVGLGMLLQASELAYLVLKWIGALYLLYLGVRLILDSGGGARTAAADPVPQANWLLRGLLTNLLNPRSEPSTSPSFPSSSRRERASRGRRCSWPEFMRRSALSGSSF
jgi:threonine/homoserine/homoserine lactone efflux protein